MLDTLCVFLNRTLLSLHNYIREVHNVWSLFSEGHIDLKNEIYMTFTVKASHIKNTKIQSEIKNRELQT